MSLVPQWSNWYVRVTWLLAFSKLGHISCFLLHKIISRSSEREHLNVECVCRRVLSSHLWEAHTICGNVRAECNAMAGHAGCSVPVSLSTLSAWMLVHVYVCAFCKFYDRRLLQKKKLYKDCHNFNFQVIFLQHFCQTVWWLHHILLSLSPCTHCLSCCRIQTVTFFHWSCCTYPIYTVFHNTDGFKTTTLYAAHTVLLFVFLQKRMNKLLDWNLCQYKNDIHLFFKCRWWMKWVAYQVQRINGKESLTMWQSIR